MIFKLQQPLLILIIIFIILSIHVYKIESTTTKIITTTKKQTNLRQRHLLQDINEIPNPESEEEHPRVAYPMKTEDLNWYSANFIPKKNGGKSLVPMPDGMDIAKKGSSKINESQDGYNAEPIEAPMAEKKDQTFKVGTDKEYMSMQNNGHQQVAQPQQEGQQGDMSKDASLYNDGGKEIDPPGVNPTQ